MLATALFLSGCGGGGDAPADTPPPAPTPAPVITSQPASQSTSAGATVSFSVSASGSGLVYAWTRATVSGGAFTAIAGATQPSLSVGPADVSMSGYQYRVIVQNAGGAVTSNAATLTVTAVAGPPAITEQPSDQVAVLPEDNDFDPRRALFRVAATGSPTPTVQWQMSTDPLGVTYTDVPGATASTYSPTGLTLADSGKRFRAVLRNSVTAVSSRGALLQVLDLGIGAVPRGFALQSSGELLVAASNSLPAFSGLRTVGPTRVRTLAGGAGGMADGSGAAAGFGIPRALVLDAAGNAYLTEGLFAGWVRKVTPTGVVSTIAGNSVNALVDGTGAQASFNDPAGLTLGADGNLYVADRGNSAIRRVTPAGVVSTFAGGTAGAADGVGRAAQFTSPWGIAADAAGNLWVAEGLPSCRIRKISPDATVSTVSNTGCGVATDGPLGTARFSSPTYLAFDGLGNLFVSDFVAIRKITPSGTVSSPRAFVAPDNPYLNGPIAADDGGNFYIARARGSAGVIERQALDGSRTQFPQ